MSLEAARRVGLSILLGIVTGGAILAPRAVAAASKVEQDGTIRVPAFVLPQSNY